VSAVGWTLLANLLRWKAGILSHFIFYAITDYKFIFHFVFLIQGKISRMNCHHYKKWFCVFWELNAVIISLLEQSTTGLVFVLRMRCNEISVIMKEWFGDEFFFWRWSWYRRFEKGIGIVVDNSVMWLRMFETSKWRCIYMLSVILFCNNEYFNGWSYSFYATDKTWSFWEESAKYFHLDALICFW
jgi:hypothetical protein